MVIVLVVGSGVACMRARARVCVCFKGKLVQVMNTNTLGVSRVQNTAGHNLKVVLYRNKVNNKM